MIKIIILTLFLFNTSAFSYSDQYTYKLVEVEKLSFEGKQYQTNRDPFFPGKTDWDKKLNLLWNVRLWRIFWENNLYGSTDKSQVKSVGWQFNMGAHVLPYLDILHDHNSFHWLDGANLNQRFPVSDSYGFRLNFIQK